MGCHLICNVRGPDYQKIYTKLHTRSLHTGDENNFMNNIITHLPYSHSYLSWYIIILFYINNRIVCAGFSLSHLVTKYLTLWNRCEQKKRYT